MVCVLGWKGPPERRKKQRSGPFLRAESQSTERRQERRCIGSIPHKRVVWLCGSENNRSATDITLSCHPIHRPHLRGYGPIGGQLEAKNLFCTNAQKRLVSPLVSGSFRFFGHTSAMMRYLGLKVKEHFSLLHASPRPTAKGKQSRRAKTTEPRRGIHTVQRSWPIEKHRRWLVFA